MKTSLFIGAAGLALIASTSIKAQDVTSASGSNAEAASGSASQAQSDNNSSQAQQQNNAGIGNSDSVSVSASDAVSGSVSGSESNGNQQGQSASLTNTNTLGQATSQGNSQGVNFHQTWNTTNRKVTEVRTNAAVPLAASSSFSSDYCGGTASGGASIAPIGVSIGGAGPTFDKSCQSLRRAEKFGMAAANWHNLGYDDRAVAMMRMMEWSICTSDSRGPKADTSIAEACDRVLAMAGSPPSAPAPKTSAPPEVPPYATPDVEKYKAPRGELEFESKPVTQELSMVTAISTAP